MDEPNEPLALIGMADKLPPEILSRPKTLLGNIHESLLSTAKSGCIENINPAADLPRFINPNRIDELPTLLKGGADSYVNLRPILLNTWLEGLQS